jgi:hypothetical protein
MRRFFNWKNMDILKKQSELLAKVMQRIEKEEVARARRKKIISSLGLAVSGGLFIAGLYVVWVEAGQAGLPQIFSLLVSDLPSVVAVWQQFCMLVLESLPVTGLMLVTASIFVALESLKSLAVSRQSGYKIIN